MNDFDIELNEVCAAYSMQNDARHVAHALCEFSLMVGADVVTFHRELFSYAIVHLVLVATSDPGANLAAVILVVTERAAATWHMLSPAERLALRMLLHFAGAVEAMRCGRPHLDEIASAVRCAALAVMPGHDELHGKRICRAAVEVLRLPDEVLR